MHTDAVKDADQYTDSVWAETDAREAAELELAEYFIRDCKARDVTLKAGWAPLVADSANWNGEIPYDQLPRRVQTLGECMNDSLDYGNGPSTDEAMALLLELAYSADTVNLPSKARKLLARMADTFATYNVS